MMDPHQAGSLRDRTGDDPDQDHSDHRDFDLDINGDRLREECGVFGIYGHPEAAAITALGLHALQHRGQEAAGIVSYDGSRFHSERRLGLVGDARSKRSRFIDRFIESLRALEGAYSLVALTNKKLIGARDPLGIRPLVLGDLDGCPILTSETCALDMIGAKYVRDIEPGEIIVFDEKGANSHKPFPPKPPRPCIFEYIYFS